MKKLKTYTRREILNRTAMSIAGLGLGATIGCTHLNKFVTEPKYNLDSLFPRYKDFDPLVPVWCVTPDLDRCIHRFHLSSPFSPSGRYLGLTRLSREDRPPKPGEPAEIVLVDLITGEQKIIAETTGWDTQLGAQVQWGATDRDLLFNDVDPATWIDRKHRRVRSVPSIAGEAETDPREPC